MTVIAFDFGERRIGVAVGETETRIANPLETIDAVANAGRFARIDALVEEWQPELFVVGEPRHADGSPHAIAALAAKFARRLTARYRVRVVMVDETLSSASAESSLRTGRASARKRADVDAVAASVILQSYLDQPEAHRDAAS